MPTNTPHTETEMPGATRLDVADALSALLRDTGTEPRSDSQLEALTLAVAADLPVLLWGEPGIGKTAALTQLAETLDLSRPVALSLIAVLHFFPDSDDPHGILRQLLEPLPSGSYVAITSATPDFAPRVWARISEIYREQGINGQLRTREQFTRFFDGLDLVDPGVTPVHHWRPDGDLPAALTDAQVSVYGAVARKP